MRQPTRAFTPALLTAFAAVILVLIVSLAVAVTNLAAVYANANAVAHTDAVTAQLESVLNTLVDAETGERGFIITADPAYLEPYTSAIDAIADELQRARQLTADNPAQQSDLDRVTMQAHVKLDELAGAVRARRESGFETAQAIIATNVGKRTMDDIRVVVRRMEAREDALLALRTAGALTAYNRARVGAVVITGVALAIVGALFVTARRVDAERTLAVNVAEQLRVTLASIGDGVMATDDAGRITHVNPVAAHLVGWPEREAIGKPLADVFVIINEDSRQPVANPIERVLREGVIVGLANHTVLMARDGREIPVGDSAAPITAADGRVIGAVLVFRDVTERRRVERERSNLIAELETAVRARDDFLSIASHELRNPVNAIQLQLVGILRAFHKGTQVDASDLQQRVDHTAGQVGRLTRLLDNLLDVSRIDSESVGLEPERLDLTEVVAAVLEQHRADAAPGQIALIAQRPVVGTWDRLRLEQIVSNLLSNAIKYGNGQPIAISVERDDQHARLTVTDRGIGIAPDQQGRLFRRFERGVTRRQYGGFGLGLWITRRLVDAMGGQISVESRLGEGATFSIVLPLERPATATSTAST